MVLSAALHQSRHDHDDGGVYLFAPDFPEYDRRMEVISLLTRMWMEWDCGMTLAPPKPWSASAENWAEENF